jgi:polysaccharide pyruvyl transferase WcaK-like protein
LWQPLFAVAGVHLISLQYGDHRAEIEEFNRGQTRPLIVFDELDPLRELEQFAAAVSALDLVLSIDNSTVHLAGALGVPTWALLPAHADYRWMTERTDSPWYAAVRLWRQQDARDPATWNALLTEIAQALAGYKPAPRAEVTASGLPLPPQWENAEAKAAALPRADLAPSGLPLPPQWDNAEVRAAASPRAEVAPAGLPLPPQWERVGVRATAFPRALLLNDTSYWYHWGCTCTSLALHEQLRARGLRVSSLHIGDILQRGAAPPPAHPAAFDDADVYAQFAQRHSAAINALQSADLVVVNGEGTLHGLSHGALSLLYLAYIAKTRLGKPVHVINHSCYPSSEPAHLAAATALYAHAYRVFDSVAVREPLSAENVRAFGVEPIVAFDSLPLYLAAHPLPAVAKQDTLLIAGSVAWSPAMLDALAGAARIARKQGLRVQVLVGANASLAADDVSFVQALHARLNGAYELVATHNETQWLTAIAQARLLVSGRFHHSIAAACVGTPFLLGDSNTAKIDGLLQMLELPAEQVRFVAGTSIDKQVHALLARREAGLIRPATRARLIALGRENFRYSF